MQAARRRMTSLSLDSAATETLAEIWATTAPSALSQEKAEEVEEVKAPLTWAPTTPLTFADLEKDESMADELSEIEDMDVEDQASERYRLLHRVACKRGYLQYIDPTSGYTVFTKLFLERRACCGYRCRHCPWGHKNVPKDSKKNLEW